MQYNSNPLSHASGERRPRLGTNTGLDSGQVRADRYRLQNTAARLLPGERVAKCMRVVLDGLGGVDVVHVERTHSAHYGGLLTCGSVWACPICAAKVTSRRRDELQEAINSARKLGHRVVMLTYTFSHQRADDIRVMLSKARAAFKRLKGGRAWQQFKKVYGVVGSVRALEVTHSEENGWHPHVHELMFLSPNADLEEFESVARSMWEKAAASQGLSMNQHGFRLDDCDEHVANYVAKFGHEPSWTESAELTKWHIKKGRGVERDRSEHVTPFGLLRYASAGDERAGSLFREYALAFHGLKQLHWSKGLREALGLGKEKTDEEVVSEEEENGQVMVHISRDEWKVIIGNDCRGELLEVARLGDIGLLRSFFDELGIGGSRWYGDDSGLL